MKRFFISHCGIVRTVKRSVVPLAVTDAYIPCFLQASQSGKKKKKPINLHRASCNNVCTLPSMPQKFEKDKVSVTLVFDRSCTLTGNLSNCPG